MYYVIYQVDLKNETSHVFRAKTSGVSAASSFSAERRACHSNASSGYRNQGNGEEISSPDVRETTGIAGGA
jgi:hypothetical protein